jgi:hypothetical protein
VINLGMLNIFLVVCGYLGGSFREVLEMPMPFAPGGVGPGWYMEAPRQAWRYRIEAIGFPFCTTSRRHSNLSAIYDRAPETSPTVARSEQPAQARFARRGVA